MNGAAGFLCSIAHRIRLSRDPLSNHNFCFTEAEFILYNLTFKVQIQEKYVHLPSFSVCADCIRQKILSTPLIRAQLIPGLRSASDTGAQPEPADTADTGDTGVEPEPTDTGEPADTGDTADTGTQPEGIECEGEFWVDGEDTEGDLQAVEQCKALKEGSIFSKHP